MSLNSNQESDMNLTAKKTKITNEFKSIDNKQLSRITKDSFDFLNTGVTPKSVEFRAARNKLHPINEATVPILIIQEAAKRFMEIIGQ